MTKSSLEKVHLRSKRKPGPLLRSHQPGGFPHPWLHLLLVPRLPVNAQEQKIGFCILRTVTVSWPTSLHGLNPKIRSPRARIQKLVQKAIQGSCRQLARCLPFRFLTVCMFQRRGGAPLSANRTKKIYIKITSITLLGEE